MCRYSKETFEKLPVKAKVPHRMEDEVVSVG
jgi:hypothetical protein